MLKYFLPLIVGAAIFIGVGIVATTDWGLKSGAVAYMLLGGGLVFLVTYLVTMIRL